MKIAIGNDHRGFEAKQRLIQLLKDLGHEVVDKGATTAEVSADYPDYAFAVAHEVSGHTLERGILVCATGVGMCIAANKVDGVRAVCAHNVIEAEMSRRHNDTNILCLSADLLGDETVDQMVKVWLQTDFEGGRHQRRVEKIAEFEKKG